MIRWWCIVRDGRIVSRYGARSSYNRMLDTYWQALPSRRGQPFSRARCEAVLSAAGLELREIALSERGGHEHQV